MQVFRTLWVLFNMSNEKERKRCKNKERRVKTFIVPVPQIFISMRFSVWVIIHSIPPPLCHIVRFGKRSFGLFHSNLFLSFLNNNTILSLSFSSLVGGTVLYSDNII